MLNLLGQKRNQLIIVILLTTLAYANIFGNEFVIDDRTFIVDWQAKNSFDMVSFFKGEVPAGHEGVYRPLRSVFYAFYYSIFGQSPLGYHLHSMVVHLASTVLVYFIVKEIFARGPVIASSKFPPEGRAGKVQSSKLSNGEGFFQKSNGQLSIVMFVPFVAALLFGLHPVHTETIAYISSAMEATGIVFALLSFYLYLLGKKYYWWSVAAAVTAFFTHEITLVLPILVLLYELTIGPLSSRGVALVALRTTKRSE